MRFKNKMAHCQTALDSAKTEIWLSFFTTHIENDQKHSYYLINFHTFFWSLFRCQVIPNHLFSQLSHNFRAKRKREREKGKKINNSVKNNFKAESILNSHVHMGKVYLPCPGPMGLSVQKHK